MSTTAVTLTWMVVMMATCVIQTSEAKTVVIIPYPSTSHSKYLTNVARVMAQRGHQVWVTLPTYILEKGYLDTSGFSTIVFDTAPGLEETMQTKLSDSYFESQDKLFDLLKIGKEVCDLLLKNESFLQTIENKRPDLIVIDNVVTFYTMSILPYKLGIPFALLGSSYFAQLFRIPFSPADMPLTFLPHNNKLNFNQRLQASFYYFILAVYNPLFHENAVLTYAPEKKYLSVSALINQAEIILVELDHVLDYPKPTLPNVKLIGGTATGPAKALPPEFQTFMGSAKEGVVIVSFGSYMLSLPKHIGGKILKALMQLPMKSVFRSNLTSPDPKKILTARWIPQNDLLGHPHTKVFVSHCGKNGQYEALYHAVPVVAIPLFADQPYNAERVRVKGFAEVLDLKTCTVEKMTSTILTVASEPSYKQNVVKYSRLFKELYGVPMETAAYWLDHVMEYGGDYMRSAGQEMPLYQYLLLDVVLFIMCVLSLTLALLYALMKALCTCLRKRKVKSE